MSRTLPLRTFLMPGNSKFKIVSFAMAGQYVLSTNFAASLLPPHRSTFDEGRSQVFVVNLIGLIRPFANHVKKRANPAENCHYAQLGDCLSETCSLRPGPSLSLR